ncbi:MAG: helix-turn-helix domain-containing protein [Scytonema sp. RU_4_4]|nr:helix-turn-helix domain-containing protein [Scytonema sp. RU_4_4]NJR72545.1 helix-turn-helix domain-containing protein [Scytonema sp. CRU_2_7]
MAEDTNPNNKRQKIQSVGNSNNSGIINLSNLVTKADPNLLLDKKQLIMALRSDFSEGIKQIAIKAAIKIIRDTWKQPEKAEDEAYVEEVATQIVESFTTELKNNTELESPADNVLDKAIPVAEPQLQPIAPVPSSAVMFSSMEAYTRKDLWQKDTEGIAYLQHRAKGNPKNYIEHYISSPGDITMLPWDEAQQIIDKFGFTTAKLHLIFAAHAMNQEKPWQSTFNLKASDIIQEFGWDKNHKKLKSEKLLEIASTAFALDCLLVKTVWVEGRNKRGEIIGSVPVGRMWNVQIKATGQFNLEGKINNPDEVYITIQPGLWTQDFLNRAGAKSREALYQFGYLAQQVLKIDPYHDELALRLAIYLTLDSRVRLDGKYRVIELLEIAFPKTVIDQARLDRRKAYDLKQRWDSAIKLLLKLDWQIMFDAQTYPEELRPDFKDNNPKGYLEKLLCAKLTIKPPAPIPELIASKAKPKVERLQSKVKPKVEQVQHEAKVSPPQDISLTSSQVREARIAKEWTQAKLAGFLGVSQKLISLIERGERTVNPQLAAQMRTLLDL